MGHDSTLSSTRTLWADTTTLAKFPRQSGQVTVDVCIVGAGIAGLTAAQLLKDAGKTVAVVDLGRVGCGESGHTSAHLTEVFDIDYRELTSHFGVDGARLAAESLRTAIDRIEQNSVRLGIDCDFSRVAGFQFTEKLEQVSDLEREGAAAAKIGVSAVFQQGAPLPFRTHGALRFDKQAQFNPLKYIAGLAKRIVGDGSYVFEETRMVDMSEGQPCRVTTEHGTITADEVFIAANVPSSNRFFTHTKIAAYRTYAISLKLAGPALAAGLFWDIDDPYHYVRTYSHNDESYLIVGGEDHKTGQDVHAAAHFQRLEEWATARFGALTISGISHRWSGQIIEPVDGLPYVGRNALSSHSYIATGFSGTGLAMGVMSGMLVSDLILGQQNPWVDLYDPSRVKPLASIRSFLAENIDYPSHLIGDRLAPAQAKGTDLLRENEGAIVRMGGKKVAAYRDPQGELHLLSPVCPHLGCHVNWNDAEKSWDCPCHGARFAPQGKLLNGPALSDLASESVDENVPMVPERYETPVTDPLALGIPLMSVFSCPLTPKLV